MVFANVLGLECENLDSVMHLDTSMVVRCKFCRIVINGCKLSVDLIIMPMELYDVILGVNCLSKYRTKSIATTKELPCFLKVGLLLFIR